MSSVTRFLRQIPTGQTLYGDSANSLVAIAAAACEFVPTSGNYVGNYPPGLVAPASNAVRGAITNAANNLTSQVPIVRDMGKTIFAQTATSLTNAQSGVGSGSFGYFRQIQVLVPQPINAIQGFMGGIAGNSFGVMGGSPDAYTPYLTVYVPTTVAGVFPTFPVGSTPAVPAPLPNGPQGQM